ncbi:hypothetical protein FRB97_007696 [Tulasnella sp. 331]|nr:hypothetical protein FRB97_007696 [Tulasnella sp. 331]
MVERARRVKEDEERRLREAERHRLFDIEAPKGVLLNVAFQRVQEEMIAGKRRIQAVEDLELEELLSPKRGRVAFARHAANEKGLHTYPNAGKVLRALIRKEIGPLLLKKDSHELEKAIQEVQSSASADLQQADRPDHQFSPTDPANPLRVAREDIAIRILNNMTPAGFDLAFPAVVLFAMHSAEAAQILSRQTETIEREDTRQLQRRN